MAPTDPTSDDNGRSAAPAPTPGVSGAHAPAPAAARTSGLQSALPSTGARLLAFLAIVVGGTCGGLIGYAFTGLQCSGDCSTGQGLGGLFGAVVGAGGVAVVSVLALRAMGEWKSIQERDEQAKRRS